MRGPGIMFFCVHIFRCNHDDEEIEQTRIELMDSLTKEKELRKQLAGRDKEIEERNTKVFNAS